MTRRVGARGRRPLHRLILFVLSAHGCDNGKEWEGEGTRRDGPSGTPKNAGGSVGR